MVIKAERRRMLEFTEGLIANSGFTVQSRDYPFIRVQTEKGALVYVALHSIQMTFDEFDNLNRRNLSRGIYTAHVFFKDGKLFHVRLGAKGNFKSDDRSLKKYTKEEINRMIHLRGLEKKALDLQRDTNNLIYYQPRTERLEEALREYNLGHVILDYSHVDIKHQAYGFVKNRESIDYRIANEVFHTSERIKFNVINRGNLQAIISRD